MASTDWYHRTTAGRPRIESLTGLRWVAAFAVFLSHFGPPADAPTWIVTFCSSGYMGVTIFFVLSGFILTVTYQQSLSYPSGSRLGNYAIARLARIYPLYLVVLLWVFANPAAAIPPNWWTHFAAVQTWSPNLSLAYALNGPGWSIGVEMFLYACFPLLLVCTRRLLASSRGSAIVALAGVSFIVAVLAWVHLTGRAALPWDDPNSAHRWIYRMPVSRLGDFALGMGVAGLYGHLRTSHEGRRWSVWAAWGSLITIATLMSIPMVTSTAASFDLLYAVPAAVLILALALSPQRGLSRLLGSVQVVALGEASYAFYLIHVPVGTVIGAGVLASGLSFRTLLSYVLTVLLLIALSWGLHTIIERPARVTIRRLVHFGGG